MNSNIHFVLKIHLLYQFSRYFILYLCYSWLCVLSRFHNELMMWLCQSESFANCCLFVCSCIVFSLVECLLILHFVKYIALSFCCWIFFSCYFQNYIFLLISNNSDSLLKCIWCSWLNGFEDYVLLLKFGM